MNLSTAVTNKLDDKPWYREPWPWLLMAGPFAVIVASFISAWVAISSSDGLVTEDYYKQGMAAGETLARSKHADEFGITAAMRLTESSVQIRLSARQADMAMPTALLLTLSHPTRPGLDQKSQLKPVGDSKGGTYVGSMHLPASGHWLLLVEDEAKTWRLMGSVVLPAANETVIGGSDSASVQ